MKNKLVLFAVGAIALLILPLFAQYFGDGWVRILDSALLYMMLALGLNIVVGYAGLLDLGYVAFYAVGAYLFGLLASPHLTETFDWFKNAFQHGLHAPVWLVIPLGARWWPARSACCWARPRCGCAATTWPSSRSASARSSACS